MLLSRDRVCLTRHVGRDRVVIGSFCLPVMVVLLAPIHILEFEREQVVAACLEQAHVRIQVKHAGIFTHCYNGLNVMLVSCNAVRVRWSQIGKFTMGQCFGPACSRRSSRKNYLFGRSV